MRVDDRWRQYRGDLEQGTVRSMAAAAGIAIAAAHAKPSRYRIDQIKNNTTVDVPIRVAGGWVIDIRWPDFRARWFDRGTYEKLGGSARLENGQVRGRGKAGRYQYHGVENRGVKPQRFMAAARRVGRLALIEALARNLR